MSALDYIASVTATVEPTGPSVSAALSAIALRNADRSLTVLDKYKDINHLHTIFLQKSGFPILVDIREIHIGTTALIPSSVASVYLFGYLLRAYVCTVNGQVSLSERTTQLCHITTGLANALKHAVSDARELQADPVLASSALSTAAGRFRHYALDIVSATSLKVPGNHDWDVIRGFVKTWLAIKLEASDSISIHDKAEMLASCQDFYAGGRKIKTPTVV